jgi:tRNA wybutosine-synthesizing protein 1
VGKSWKWKVDNPEFLLEQALQQHRQMIRECRGVPGVTSQRLEEANMPRHCALSLVGEPIIYPYINQFIALLHQKRISTFLVTNAQFPEKIEQLCPVTQLYVSVDAATKETLKVVDRPLFEDFWERFLHSIDVLSKKGQRTVFRLTLIKEWNMNEIENYAALVKRGTPDFIEVIIVTSFL